MYYKNYIYKPSTFKKVIEPIRLQATPFLVILEWELFSYNI